MSRFSKTTLAPLLAVGLAGAAAPSPRGQYNGVGRPATKAEIHAWDIDVRPDLGPATGQRQRRPGRGGLGGQVRLVPGSFGESNEVHTR